MEAVLADIAKQLGEQPKSEGASDAQTSTYLHPATGQSRLPERFYSKPTNSSDTRVKRYQEVLQGNIQLTDPITYETLQQYQERQKTFNKRLDALHTEGEYWTWFMDPRHLPWLPTNIAGTYQRTGDSRRTGPRYLAHGHEWLVDGEFHAPDAWLHYRFYVPQCLPLMRRLYLIAYSKAFWIAQPLPFETERLFVRRQQRFASEDALKELERVKAIYEQWIQEPRNERLRNLEMSGKLDGFSDDLLETLQRGFR